MAAPAVVLALPAPGDESPHAMLGKGHDDVDEDAHEDEGRGREEFTPRWGVPSWKPEDLDGEVARAPRLLSAAAAAEAAAGAEAADAVAVDAARDTTSILFTSSSGGGGAQEEENVDEEEETDPRENTGATGATGALPIPHNSAASNFTSIISSTRIASDDASVAALGETSGRLGSSAGPATTTAAVAAEEEAAGAERLRGFRPLPFSPSERSSSSMTSQPPVAILLPPS